MKFAVLAPKDGFTARQRELVFADLDNWASELEVCRVILGVPAFLDLHARYGEAVTMVTLDGPDDTFSELVARVCADSNVVIHAPTPLSAHVPDPSRMNAAHAMFLAQSGVLVGTVADAGIVYRRGQ